MKNSTNIVLALLLAVSAASGCARASGEVGSEPAAARSGTTPAGASPVARIVFVDQEQACECTRNRIEGSWAALQAALGEGSTVPVERIHRDSQSEQAEEYRRLRPMVTVPAIYLLDRQGGLVELLQGEVSAEQVRAALGGRG